MMRLKLHIYRFCWPDAFLYVQYIVHSFNKIALVNIYKYI